ncbi:hypothetical protein P168DRAFT_316578 [Aspergillus campestris IBT 28561]|uniref:Uncharacterized protein n=1 Tax=Aspergillus campestris (strain IBT 28561) TaxID=1392248 RepID=A0A2I1D9M8_ASPC2|nr:uncharacterized protein P168DRAFT_316578 [Aspergillus campestris IBT 28561]PKY06578.1 hypothetical protein P168DRAFT_316578 [Aspergillus campestris IBT 28561]
MNLLTYLHALLALPILATALPAPATEYTYTTVVKDATIVRSGNCTDCPSGECNQCTLGLKDTLMASATGEDESQILVGLEQPMPGFSVKSCSILFPGFGDLLPNEFKVTFALALSSDWDEATVNGDNAPPSAPAFKTVTVPPLTRSMDYVDITPACRSAGIDGRFSLYLTALSEHAEIWGKDSGNAAMLKIVPL